MKNTMGQKGAARQEPRKSRFLPRKGAPPGPWLIIVNHLGLSNDGGFSHYPVFHAMSCGGSCYPFPCRGDGCSGRKPHFHHRQPGGWLWRRPMPRQGRPLWRLRGPLLLPITGFCPGLVLSPRRSRRDHGLGSQDRRQLSERQLRRIRRHHLPTLTRLIAAVANSATRPPRKRRAAAEPAGYGMSVGVVISRGPL